MRLRSVLPAFAALLLTGCSNPSAITRDAERVGEKVTPAVRKISESSQRVVRAASRAADDATLAAKVKGALMMRKGLDEREVRVRADEGVIRLTGRVPNRAQKRLAGEAAREVEGVTGVENRLRVTSDP
jgi:osmotically-inducible protein OsmY